MGIPQSAAPIILVLPQYQQRLLIGQAELVAADLYREWARQQTDAATHDGLLACAAREEEIARCTQALEPQANALKKELAADVSQAAELFRSLFTGRPLHEQFAILQSGERAGRKTWLNYAANEENAEGRQVLQACAELEEENAAFLESVLTKRA